MTNSLRAATGRQEPSFRADPPTVASTIDGEDAAFLSAAYGLTLDPFQEHILDAWLARRTDDRLAAPRAGVAIPRQNGKNGALEAYELFTTVVLGRKVLHTAHETKTSRKAFVRLCRFFETNDELSARVESIRKVNGQEHIMLTNGGSVEFIARSKSSGRGFTVDTLVLDEAQELPVEAMEALLPTISSAPSGDSQTIMLGTPPGPGNDGEMFTRWHDAAHEDADPGLSWMEWSADAAEGGPVDLDDPETWERANPALGGRMSIDVVLGERATFPDQSFARERLGMWATEESERVLPLAQWEACSNPNLVDDGGEVALAIDVNPARDCSSIAAAGSAVDGTPFVDVIETRRGTPEWLLERVSSICSRQPVRAVLIDGKGPAASLIDPLKRRKVKVSVTGAGNMAAAVAEFYDAVMAERLIHLDQPGLNLAAAVARKRRLGDAWAWNRKDTESDITPLVAATLALFGHTYTGVKRPRPRNTNRKVVVW